MPVIGEIRDIVNILKELKDNNGQKVGGVLSYALGDVKNNSARRMARDSIMQFPLLVSSSISRDSLATVSKALEVEYAVMLQLAISNSKRIDLSDGQYNTKGIMSRFHTNIDFDNSITGNIQDAESFGSGTTTRQVTGKFFGSNSINNEAVMQQALADNMVPYEESLNPNSINDYTVDFRLVSEAKNEENKEPKFNKFEDQLADHMSKNKNSMKNPQATVTSRIAPKELERLNDLTPLIMSTNITFIDGNKAAFDTELKFGIKAVSHYVPTDEMITYLGKSLKEENMVFRAIQWTTGEIKFFRDFLFTIDQAKRDANLSGKGSSKWFAKLKNLSKISKFKSMTGNNKIPVLPTTTIILSREEVDYIRNTEGIDILDPRNARKLSEIFMLLGLVIVDENDESVQIYDDVKDEFTFHTLKSLERDNKNNSDSNNMLKLVNAMSGRR